MVLASCLIGEDCACNHHQRIHICTVLDVGHLTQIRRCFPVLTINIINMSWDSYIDNLIAQTKDSSGTAHCDKACIIGLEDGSAWTTAAHANCLLLSADEMGSIARCFKSKDFSSFMTSGVVVEKIKYQFLREEESKLVLAKKKGQGALTLQKSKTAIVIGHSPEGSQQGNTNKGVGVIAEYLESMGM